MATLLVAVTLSATTPAGRARPPAGPQVTLQLLRVAFTSPTRGVGLFLEAVSTHNGRGRCALSTRTTADDGSRFIATGAPLFRAACGSGYPVDQIAGNGIGDLFAYGAGLIESHDNGRSWHRIGVGGTIVALAAVGTSVWALRLTGCRFGAGVCLLTVLASTDSGRSWRAAPQQPPVRRIPGAQAPELISDSTWLVRNSVTTATLVLPPAARSPEARIEQSSDGGDSWSTTTAPCLAGAYAIEYAVAPTGARWIACAGQPATGVQQKTVARSLNGGRSWQRWSSCALASRCASRVPIGGYLGGLAATGAASAFYVGDRSALTMSHDGGRAWVTEPGFSGDASGSAEVTFEDARHGWAIDLGFGGHSVLWRTRDGGAHWTRAYTS